MPPCLLADVHYHDAALPAFQEIMDDYTESNHDIMLGGHQGLTLDRWARVFLPHGEHTLTKARHDLQTCHLQPMQHATFFLCVLEKRLGHYK